VQEVVTLEDIATTNEQLSSLYLDGFLNSIVMLLDKSLCVIMFSNTTDLFQFRQFISKRCMLVIQETYSLVD
jgi:hypothetical protein